MAKNRKYTKKELINLSVEELQKIKMGLLREKKPKPEQEYRTTDDYIPIELGGANSGNVIQDFWIPTSTSNRDYLEYQEWEAIDGNTIQEAD